MRNRWPSCLFDRVCLPILSVNVAMPSWTSTSVLPISAGSPSSLMGCEFSYTTSAFSRNGRLERDCTRQSNSSTRILNVRRLLTTYPLSPLASGWM